MIDRGVTDILNADTRSEPAGAMATHRPNAIAAECPSIDWRAVRSRFADLDGRCTLDARSRAG